MVLVFTPFGTPANMSTIARLSVEEYDRMIVAGVFDSSRTENMELIHGELRVLVPSDWNTNAWSTSL